MELINTLVIKDFPGVKDGTYSMSQDTVIKGCPGSGKTSILKAITWMLTEKDLQGKSIPNISKTTKVVSRGFMQLCRDKKGLSGSLNRILQGGVNDILGRIIPGYLFSAGLTNKEVVRIISGIDMDTYSTGGITTEELTKEIKKVKVAQKDLCSISEYVLDLSQHIEYKCGKSILDTLLDFQDMLALSLEIKPFHEKLRVAVDHFMDKEDKKARAMLITLFGEIKNKTLAIMISGLTNGVELEKITMTKAKNISTIINSLRFTTNDQISSCGRFIKNNFKDSNLKTVEFYYLKLVKKTLSLGKLMEDKEAIIERLYLTVNSKLNKYGMNLSGNNSLTTKVEYLGKELLLTELPRHVRTFMEINLCSRLQLDYISNNSRDGNTTGLILIDDCFVSLEDLDVLDSILIEGLSNQVIITQTDMSQKKLKMILG